MMISNLLHSLNGSLEQKKESLWVFEEIIELSAYKKERKKEN